jgi:hypothetical protein
MAGAVAAELMASGSLEGNGKKESEKERQAGAVAGSVSNAET